MIEKVVIAIGLAAIVMLIAFLMSVLGYLWSFPALVVIFSIVPLGERR